MRAVDERIRDHVIICGFGQFSRAVLNYLGTASPPIVFVERDPDLEAQLRETGAQFHSSMKQ